MQSITDFLRYLLQIGVRDAAGRVKLSQAVSPRRMLSGQLVEPLHPQTATALAAGTISARAAGIITSTVDRLPTCVLEDAHPTVEAVLLEFAADHDPETLAQHAKTLATALDQVGASRDADLAARRRELTLRRRDDGSGTLTGNLSAECAEYLDTLLDTLAKPRPAADPDEADGGRDLRTPGQRRHDALLAGLKLLLGSGRLPKAGGCTTTVVLNMNVQDFATGQGVARTAHGYALPVELAKTWLEPEARAILVLLSRTKGIEAYSSVQRLFTEQQRLAMFARDHPRLDRRPPRHRLPTHQTHQRRRRRPGLRRQPRQLRKIGLALHHDQRPPLLGPTRLDRPPTTTKTQSPARVKPLDHLMNPVGIRPGSMTWSDSLCTPACSATGSGTHAAGRVRAFGISTGHRRDT